MYGFIEHRLPVFQRPTRRPLTCTQLPPAAYTTLPDTTPICRIIPPLPPAPNQLLDHGFHTFTLPNDIQTEPPHPENLLTKLSYPAEEKLTRKRVQQLIDNSLLQLRAERLHLIQLSCPPAYDVDLLGELSELQREGKIRSIGVTDFSLDRLRRLATYTIPIACNTVPYNILDSRASRTMHFCHEHNIGILTRNTLLNGLLSERYLGLPAPMRKPTAYGLMRIWGSWSLFQELLYTLKMVADRYGVTVAHIAMRWVLQRGGDAVLVGGGAKYAAGNVAVFDFELDAEDISAIEEIVGRGNDMYGILGDSLK